MVDPALLADDCGRAYRRNSHRRLAGLEQDHEPRPAALQPADGASVRRRSITVAQPLGDQVGVGQDELTSSLIGLRTRYACGSPLCPVMAHVFENLRLR